VSQSRYGSSGDRPGPRDLNPGDEGPPIEGTGEDVCRVCGGTGQIGGEPCRNCGGTGTIIEGIGGA
jgi:hypothetical protein